MKRSINADIVNVNTAISVELPKDALLYIFTMLDDVDRAAICSVSKYWNDVAIEASVMSSTVASVWKLHLSAKAHNIDISALSHYDYHLFARVKPQMCAYQACSGGNINVLKHILKFINAELNSTSNISSQICTCDYYEKYINSDGNEINIEVGDRDSDIIITIEKPNNDKFKLNYYRCASIACVNGNVDIIKYLLTNHYAACLTTPSDPFALLFRRSATSLFNLACASGDIETVKFILTHNPAKITHGFYEACKYGHLDIIKLLLARIGDGEPIPRVTKQPYVNMLRNCLTHVCGPVMSKTVDYDTEFTIEYDPSVITQQNKNKIEVFNYLRENYDDCSAYQAIFNAAFDNDQMLQYMAHVIREMVINNQAKIDWITDVYELAICGACCSGNLNKVKVLMTSYIDVIAEYNKLNPKNTYTVTYKQKLLDSYLSYSFTRGNIELIKYIESLYTTAIHPYKYNMCLGAACRHLCTHSMKIAIERGATECTACNSEIQDHIRGDYPDDEFVLDRENAVMAYDTSMEESSDVSDDNDDNDDDNDNDDNDNNDNNNDNDLSNDSIS